MTNVNKKHTKDVFRFHNSAVHWLLLLLWVVDVEMQRGKLFFQVTHHEPTPEPQSSSYHTLGLHLPYYFAYISIKNKKD